MKNKNTIYNSMLGANFNPKQNDKIDTFNIMYQFNNEEPQYLYSNINIEDDFVITMKSPILGQEKAEYLEFTSKSGQVLKIYGIINK